MTRLFENVRLLSVLKIPVRYKNPPHHWSILKKKKPSTQKAIDHFDDFYKSIYGDSWKPIRSAMLSKEHKYVAIVNNFSDSERVCNELECSGAMNMKDIYEASKRNMEYEKNIKEKEKFQNEVRELDKTIDKIVAEKSLEKSIHPNSLGDNLNNSDTVRGDNDPVKLAPVQLQSIENDVYIANDSSRIIMSAAGVSASQLFEYVPATKLKGMDDYVLESEHFNYYTKGLDFTIQTETEYHLNFPERLYLYTYEEGNSTRFPKPKKGSTEVSDYFVVDGASVLPVLSLDLKPGDTFLDMCAAPGGKTMMALQTFYPRLIVANDIQLSRINRINYFISDILPNIGDWDKKLFVTQSDARNIEDKNLYNKILVDVPCTTDRHALHEDDNNIFKTTRIKERLKLPELQSAILENALKLAVLGGTVVYSTCSLSPIQNDGVVQMALKNAFENANVSYVVKDQSPALAPLKYLYNFGDFGLKYGHIVVPSKSRNWGPMYFCKMVRIQ